MQPILAEVVECDHDHVLVGQRAERLGQHGDQISHGARAVARLPDQRGASVQSAGHVTLAVVHEQFVVELLRDQTLECAQRTDTPTRERLTNPAADGKLRARRTSGGHAEQSVGHPARLAASPGDDARLLCQLADNVQRLARTRAGRDRVLQEPEGSFPSGTEPGPPRGARFVARQHDQARPDRRVAVCTSGTGTSAPSSWLAAERIESGFA